MEDEYEAVALKSEADAWEPTDRCVDEQVKELNGMKT